MEKKLYDDAFYVEEKKYGLWQSHYPDGVGIITSLTEEECVRSTRWYLKAKQEGFVETQTYDGVVGGKL
jgi:hypothetical protein